jgi:hypothetical protein
VPVPATPFGGAPAPGAPRARAEARPHRTPATPAAPKPPPPGRPQSATGSSCGARPHPSSPAPSPLRRRARTWLRTTLATRADHPRQTRASRKLMALCRPEAEKRAAARNVRSARTASWRFLEAVAEAGSRACSTSCPRRASRTACADEGTLLNRYQETRRRHPLAPSGNVIDGIQRETELLEPIRERADSVIDTTRLSASMLRRKVANELLEREAPGRMAVTSHLVRPQARAAARRRLGVRRPLPSQPAL